MQEQVIMSELMLNAVNAVNVLCLSHLKLISVRFGIDMSVLCECVGLPVKKLRVASKKKRVPADKKVVLGGDVVEPKKRVPAKKKVLVPLVVPVVEVIEVGLNFKNTRAFKDLGNGKETQLQYYERSGSSAEIMKIVGLTSKSFGTECERMVSEMLQLEPRSSCQNDATFNGKKIEIKSARYWGGVDDCVWQHLEPDHDYEYVLFILVDFQDVNIWGIKKSHLMGELRDKNIVTHQGTQGWWTKKSRIISHLQPIRSVEEFESFIESFIIN